MVTRSEIRRSAYFDSVTLMRVARELTRIPGIMDAAAVMGTAANKNILKMSGLLTPELSAAKDSDLLIVVKARNVAAAEKALHAAAELLKPASEATPGQDTAPRPTHLDSAIKTLPEANMAVISVAGRYAGDLAMQCLERGLHVMLFSDNVPLEQEIALKKLAHKKGLLLMGPDCGTAIINGAPLGFANAVRRGSIGVVASAGTGLQEVTCLISNSGHGISQAIGTGSRDVTKSVGGIMFIDGLKALADDPQTRVVLAVSKPPDPEVALAIRKVLRAISKPVVTLFLGTPVADGPTTLEEAALMAIELDRGGHAGAVRQRLAKRDRELLARVHAEVSRLGPHRRYVRGLFCGGTFCVEAQVVLPSVLKGPFYSNVPTPPVRKLKNPLKSVAHTVVDFGEDEFTVGRPHPMIDFSLRNRRILQEANDPQTAVIVLDVVLGFGAHPDPASELAPVVRDAARKVPIICSLTGTDHDPQNRAGVEKALSDAGATVLSSNAAACRMAAEIAFLRQ